MAVGMQMAQQARQVLAACEKTPTDAVQLAYDPRNPFDTCPLTFTPIFRCLRSGTLYTPQAFQTGGPRPGRVRQEGVTSGILAWAVVPCVQAVSALKPPPQKLRKLLSVDEVSAGWLQGEPVRGVPLHRGTIPARVQGQDQPGQRHIQDRSRCVGAAVLAHADQIG